MEFDISATGDRTIARVKIHNRDLYPDRLVGAFAELKCDGSTVARYNVAAGKSTYDEAWSGGPYGKCVRTRALTARLTAQLP